MFLFCMFLILQASMINHDSTCVGGIRNQAFHTLNCEIISVSQV
jgi:hypothetical protein